MKCLWCGEKLYCPCEACMIFIPEGKKPYKVDPFCEKLVCPNCDAIMESNEIFRIEKAKLKLLVNGRENVKFNFEVKEQKGKTLKTSYVNTTFTGLLTEMKRRLLGVTGQLEFKTKLKK